MPKWLVVGFACCALSLVIPPLGLVAFVIGVVALRRHLQVGAALVALGVLVPIAGLVVVQTFFVKAYRLPSDSMGPTLALGDRFVAWRAGSDPHVGDIVVFHPSMGAESSNACGGRPRVGEACSRPTRGKGDVTFVKRIVAGPGDRVAIVRGRMIVNGKPRPEPYIIPCRSGDTCDFPKPVTIPPDHWFMMGDNRGASDDSRFWGPVPGDWIVGRAFFRYWPADRAGGL